MEKPAFYSFYSIKKGHFTRDTGACRFNGNFVVFTLIFTQNYYTIIEREKKTLLFQEYHFLYSSKSIANNNYRST